MFELEILKRESGLSQDQLARLEEQVRKEFPNDEMMFELHLLRVLDALKKRWITTDILFATTPKVKEVA